jgi:hypothetical protein
MSKQERAERQFEDWVKEAEAHFATQGIPLADMTSKGTFEYIAQTYGRERVLHTLRRMAGSPGDAEIVWEWGSWAFWAIAEESGIQVPPPAGTPDRAAWEKGHTLLRSDPDFAQRVRTTAQQPDNPVRRFLVACGYRLRDEKD